VTGKPDDVIGCAMTLVTIFGPISFEFYDLRIQIDQDMDRQSVDDALGAAQAPAEPIPL
jgi:hypothetical protein